ncbi:hypothetical protein MMC27_003074 [Xylographa pallens]|nr:hypothetical protein [Xylographa pallens]
MDTILENREIRSIFSLLSPPLPCELVTQILDLAEKWHLTLSIAMPQAYPPLFITHNRHSTRDACGDHLLLTSPPLTHQHVSQLRKITFTTTSLNEGWSDPRAAQGTYRHSWFDAVILPAEDQHPPAEAAAQAVGQYLYHGLPPYRHRLQFDRPPGFGMRSRKMEVRRAEGLDLFGQMREGSRVALVACARFPGFTNQVKDSGMEFWSAEMGG